ncbi:MAG: bifunctional metallophosphatase/5'-nucleotidase, partial [Atopobiaceae bacterium]|nr:bifunctional metallophosphatase/5'-nucleotidase [Atopobiaceae bacterium]
MGERMRKLSVFLITLALACTFSFSMKTHVTAEAAETPVQTTASDESLSPHEADGAISITVLHTNDVHCGIDNYPKVAGYRDKLVEEGKNVILVDAGDHVQGEAIGLLTKGEEIITIMNGTGYDVAVLGNHEFDYAMDQFLKNVSNAQYPYISANFKKADGTSVADIQPYFIMEVQGKKIAFVGISTPETYTTSTPVYFQDDNGNWVYTFNENNFYPSIQQAIDAAQSAGADVVIGIGHTGMKGSQPEWNSQSIIANTTGLDAYIDGHSHEEVAGPDYNNTTFYDKSGKAIPYAQTGTKLANLGEMTISISSEGAVSVSTSLIKLEDVTERNERVQALVDAANKMVDDYLGEVIGTAEADLTILDADGNRIVRISETNLGDFNADAFRWVTGADIALVNSGGVRKNLNKGDVSRQNLMDVNPFGNDVIKIKATGQQILDALEHGARKYPDENGGFLQVSGLTYDIYDDVESPVLADDKSAFLGIEEGKDRRVGNVKIGGLPIDPNATYTVGGTSYLLQLSGDGMTMFAGTE